MPLTPPADPTLTAVRDMDTPAVMTKTQTGNFAAGSCAVCSLPNDTLLELNLILADPNQWPKTIFEGIKLPRGALPPGYRLWGAVRMGRQYLVEHGIAVNLKSLKSHYTRHVVQVPASAGDIVQSAMLAETEVRKNEVPAVRFTPATFANYYAKGIELGQKGLQLLLNRIQKLEEKGDDVPTELLLKAADIGTKLATSAASLRTRGLELEREQEEEIEGFRAGSMALPGPDMHGTRVRVIDGEARPVTDRGRADRREYNERAEQEGLPTLPA
jgi:hypothetical protein